MKYHAFNAYIGITPESGALLQGPQKRQDPAFEGGVLVLGKEPDDYLLSHGQSALSSAWSRFTVLFGMGRGGTDSLWSSGMTGCCVAFIVRHSQSGRSVKRVGCVVSVGTTPISTCVSCSPRWGKTHLL